MIIELRTPNNNTKIHIPTLIMEIINAKPIAYCHQMIMTFTGDKFDAALITCACCVDAKYPKNVQGVGSQALLLATPVNTAWDGHISDDD